MTKREPSRRSGASIGKEISPSHVKPLAVTQGRRLWLFRLLAAVAVPTLLAAALELSLRIADSGYPTSFLLTAEQHGRKVWIQNDRFGWRFFGPNYSRTPWAFSMAREKPAGTIRIFVLGESAAFGDPQPDFGLPRMLEAMLELRFPSTRFEVVNASMTGINSHVIREIASACAKADGDLWVVYMGNNEVVGPFGSGTVFGPQAPPMALIRASLAVKSTRAGQLLDLLRARLSPPPPSKSEWGGMKMFLEHQVRADDPRMRQVYEHFEQNLDDIIDLGRNADNGIVVCNVAVNLRDCAPFASSPRPNLREEEKTRWLASFEQGVALQTQQNFREALATYDQAARIDESIAELQFRRGVCALQLGDTKAAARDLALARDLDTLRFRSDSRLSDIAETVVSERVDDRVRFTDAEAVFAAQSPNGIPGRELFYEHVHLTWEGNWLLARTIAEQVLHLLPKSVTARTNATPAWPTADQCARRLAWSDRNQLSAVSDILGRLNEPPWTSQLNHREQVTYLGRLTEELAPTAHPSALLAAQEICEEAVQISPDDPTLQGQLARLMLEKSDFLRASAAAQKVVQLLPHAPSSWHLLSTVLARAGQTSDSIQALETALRLEPHNVWTLHNLALAHAVQGEQVIALREWRKVLAIKPRFGMAYLGVGQILESQGKTKEAEEHYRKALANPIHRGEELAILGRFCMKKGWYDEAVTNLQNALRLSPVDAAVHLDLARSLAAIGRSDEALVNFEAGARLDPSQMESHFRLGLELGRTGRFEEAAKRFQQVVRLNPELVEARVNLAVSYAKQGLNTQALEEFAEVLHRSPTNQTALRYVQDLQNPSDLERGESVEE